MKQGENGVSLQEQKSEIERYAKQKGLAISTWFEERETAAKFGRPIFMQMVKRLRNREVAGVVIHKIDRSARNLRDWVDVADLSDLGIEVHFTRESLDLRSSSGRLAADVQAVVAANYVRNLREETIKGFYGRLKQGIYPMPAPLGYLNMGGGKPKAVDPVRGPLIRKAFELYASEQHSLYSLMKELQRQGLRARNGRPISKNTLADLLSNPFYYGLIRIKKDNQSFKGAHEPLISSSLFDQVQAVKAGKHVRVHKRRREFLFSRMIRCIRCHRSLIPAINKGHTYYRCQTRDCPITAFREELIETRVCEVLEPFHLKPEEVVVLERFAARKRATAVADAHEKQTALNFTLTACIDRMNRLTDVYVDGHLDETSFKQRKEALLTERLILENELNQLANPSGAVNRVDEFVKLAKTLYQRYKTGSRIEKRQILRDAMLNLVADRKTLVFTVRNGLSELLPVLYDRDGGPPKDESDTPAIVVPEMKTRKLHASHEKLKQLSMLRRKKRNDQESLAS
jgi:DNA invertase Pin-like site-specific DNA recombinase